MLIFSASLYRGEGVSLRAKRLFQHGKAGKASACGTNHNQTANADNRQPQNTAVCSACWLLLWGGGVFGNNY